MQNGNAQLIDELAPRIAEVQARIAKAAEESGRTAADITLVAASKMNDAARVRAAQAAGIAVFGENRVQELLEKYEQHAYDGADLQFIGSLQTNKVKFLVGKVSLIHSVNSLRLCRAIDQIAKKVGICQNILLEVNIGRESSKTGMLPEEIPQMLEEISQYDNIRVCGFMAIPPAATSEGENLRYFCEMQQLFVDISQKKYDNVYMGILSMGMSADFEDAIRCGSTMVRVGASIFGARQYHAL